MDRNGNGSIDSAAELFGDHTAQTAVEGVARNGFLALAEFDKSASGGNNDGVISALDAIWPRLLLWNDANHNGMSEPQELRSLSSVGIVGLELRYRESKWIDDAGNLFRYRAKVILQNDSTAGRWAFDILPTVQN